MDEGYASRSGHGTLLGGSLISLSSGVQSIVAQSSAEAEYYSAVDIANEIIWLKQLLSNLWFPQGVVMIHEDNQALRKMTCEKWLGGDTSPNAEFSHCCSKFAIPARLKMRGNWQRIPKITKERNIFKSNTMYYANMWLTKMLNSSIVRRRFNTRTCSQSHYLVINYELTVVSLDFIDRGRIRMSMTWPHVA